MNDTTKLVKLRLARAHHRAISNWLTKYEAPPNGSNYEKFRGRIEASYHLSEVEEWEKIAQILMQQDEATGKQLSRELGNWGHYSEQIILHQKLIGKLNTFVDCFCMDVLGTAHLSLGDYSTAIDFFQRALDIAFREGMGSAQGSILGNLGRIYNILAQPLAAIEAYQQQLKTARAESDNRGESLALLPRQ